MTTVVPGGRRLGEILVDAQVLGPEPLAEALDRQRESGMRLGAVLVEMGLLDEHTVVAALGAQLGLPVADLRHHPPDPEALRALPKATARRLTAIPVRAAGTGLEVAVADPLDRSVVAELERVAGREVRLLIAAATDVRTAIDQCYRAPRPRRVRPPVPDDGLDALLSEAVRAGANAIHLEETPAGVRIRFRIDGALRPAPAALDTTASDAVRHLEGLARTRHGRFNRSVDGCPVEFRVVSAVTVSGKATVVTVVPPRRPPAGLSELGLPPNVHERLSEALRNGTGLVVVAGPRGGGLSTTLYAALAEVDTPERCLVAVDDPPPFVVPGVVQAKVGWQALADLDPDIVLMGDIDDVEAARAAARLANGGPLVLAGFHGAGGAQLGPARLVVRQRLLRRTCAACRVPYRPSLAELELAAGAEGAFFQGEGCRACGGTGYAGRVGVFAVGDDPGALVGEALRLAAAGETSLSEALLTPGGTQ